MAKTVFDTGIPRRKIFSHTVGYASYDPYVSCTFTPPIWVAVNPYCIPGYTMSPITCRYNIKNLRAEIAKRDSINEFANVEGYAAGVNEEAKAAAYFKEFFVENNCRIVSAFAFGENPPIFSFPATSDFGYTIAANRWLSGEFEKT